MKRALFVVASLCALSSISAKVFVVKQKNQNTYAEEFQKITVNLGAQTETVESKNQTFIKDFNTGYAAIKLKKKNVCFVYKEHYGGKSDSANKDEKYLEALQASGKREHVLAELSEKLSVTGMTKEQRALVGDKIVQFCGKHKMVLGLSYESDDDDDDDDEDVDADDDNDADTEDEDGADVDDEDVDGDEDVEGGSASETAGKQRKRSLIGACAWKTVRKCAKLNLKIKGCKKRVWGVCILPKISFKPQWNCRNIRELAC